MPLYKVREKVMVACDHERLTPSPAVDPLACNSGFSSDLALLV